MALEILVIPEQQSGKLTRSAWEAVAAAQCLAEDLGASVVGAVLGSSLAPLAQELATASLQEVVTVESPLLADYTADGYSAALVEVIAARQPRLVVFSHTYQVRDFAPKLAAALDGGFVSDCLGYRKESSRLVFVRQVFQGKFCADVEFAGDGPNLVSFQASAFREDAVRRGTSPAKISAFNPKFTAGTIRAKPGERFREAKQAVDLTQAEVIVAVGRGIKAQENLELAKKLADSLGAEVGASRPICDSGWLPMDRQIGSSGQTIAPKLYIGLGVSGAIQHQVGMKGSRVVVAINKDKEAPIFEVATYGIVGDLFEVVPPLIEEIKKVKAPR
ncbi:MAG: electron transfer flavoprotein subunit alpha/FixB family protein [Acidobacteria bacterium]|nr:electron transfer flavoprotein subunit alpha/FixB family protein [Acidobacteriota bacterium]